MSRNQQVVRYGDRWAVRREGSTRVVAVYNSRKEAVSEAKKIVKNTTSNVIIYSSRHNVDETNKMEKSCF